MGTIVLVLVTKTFGLVGVSIGIGAVVARAAFVVGSGNASGAGAKTNGGRKFHLPTGTWMSVKSGFEARTIAKEGRPAMSEVLIRKTKLPFPGFEHLGV
jgi:hypothetical protein